MEDVRWKMCFYQSDNLPHILHLTSYIEETSSITSVSRTLPP